jgi:hypothetical protein
MVPIATLTSLLGFLQKFFGIAARAGLPDEFYQKVIDDRAFRDQFVAWAKERLIPSVSMATPFASDPPLVDANRNPFELSVEVQIAALRRANDEEGWGIEDGVFARLAETAPAWPEGRLAFRSLRIRWDEGDEGVALTFERHVERIKKVFGGKFWRWDYLVSGRCSHNNKLVDCLRLLNGNDSHKPVVEWVTFDLNANRERSSITAVRDSRSLADELFAFVWMFPDYIRSINYEENPGIFAGGYELNVPGSSGESWRNVPYVGWGRGSARVEVHAIWRSNNSSSYFVPVLLE